MNLLFITYKVDETDSLVGFVVGWLNALADRLAHLDVICLARGPAQLRDNVNVYALNPGSGARRVARAFEFYRLALGIRADVVFCQFSPIFAIAIAPIARLRGWPIVLWYTHRHVDLKLRLAVALADRVVTASPESFRLASRKVRVIGHGIDTERFQPAPSPPGAGSRKSVLAVGRIAPIKNYETLIEAAGQIVSRRAEVDFLVAGGVEAAGLDDYCDGLRALASQRGLGHRFRFLGPLPQGDMPDLYRRAAIAVNLCPTGGLDKAVLEGLASGVPTVLCNRSFAPLLGDQTERALIPEGDAAALAGRLTSLLDAPDRDRMDIASKLRERVVAQHGLEGLADRLVKVLEETKGRARAGDGQRNR